MDQKQEKRIANILNSISPDLKDSTNLRINLDRVGTYLMRENNLRFSMTKFEKELEKEMRKVQGYPVTPQLLKRIALYIDDLAVYLTAKQGKIEATRFEEVRARREQRLRERQK